jgi:hypothetical protein
MFTPTPDVGLPSSWLLNTAWHVSHKRQIMFIVCARPFSSQSAFSPLLSMQYISPHIQWLAQFAPKQSFCHRIWQFISFHVFDQRALPSENVEKKPRSENAS